MPLGGGSAKPYETCDLAGRSTCQRSGQSSRPTFSHINQVDPMGLNIRPKCDFGRGPWGRPGYSLFGASLEPRRSFRSLDRSRNRLLALHPEDRLLLFAPHSDEESVALGGLIALAHCLVTRNVCQ
jgi:hypothetical protein